MNGFVWCRAAVAGGVAPLGGARCAVRMAASPRFSATAWRRSPTCHGMRDDVGMVPGLCAGRFLSAGPCRGGSRGLPGGAQASLRADGRGCRRPRRQAVGHRPGPLAGRVRGRWIAAWRGSDAWDGAVAGTGSFLMAVSGVLAAAADAAGRAVALGEALRARPPCGSLRSVPAGPGRLRRPASSPPLATPIRPEQPRAAALPWEGMRNARRCAPR